MTGFVPLTSDAGYSLAEATKEAARCIQCECMECVKVCQYMAHYKKYPKKYIRQFFNNEKVLLGASHSSNLMINSCTNCGLCATVCPNNLSMGDVCLAGRHAMLQGNYMPPSAHEFALQDMAFSTGEEFVLSCHQPGTQKSAYLYFPSCQLSATAPAEVLESYRALCDNLSGGVGILLGCCGAPCFLVRSRGFVSRDSGNHPHAMAGHGTARSDYRLLHLPERIQGASARDYRREAALERPGDSLVDRSRLPRKKPPPVGQIAVVDPCVSRNDPETQSGVRRILGNLGFALEELPLSGERAECCGYGGLVFNANPKLDNAIVARRAAESDKDYLAYCAMCRDKFVNAGKRTAHLIELLFPSIVDNDPLGARLDILDRSACQPDSA